MNASTRLAVNSCAQYLKTVINIVLGFYSTRLILLALGESDFGIYSLVAGITSFLAFICTSLTITTQRFLSFHQKSSSIEFQQKLFYHSQTLQLGIGLVVCIALEIVGLFLFDGFLNITPERIYDAKIVYQCTIGMTLMGMISSPFQAALVAHENLVYTSIIGIIDGILKVIIALGIAFVPADRLVVYSILMLGLWVVSFLMAFIYAKVKYEECKLPAKLNLDFGIFREMSKFAGWTIYNTGCTMLRLQGTSIILNKFFGTVANAAFGIALTLNSATMFLSSSILNAINPQIVKAEGVGDRSKMLSLSLVASKMSFFMLSMVIIPMCIYTPEILKFWLKVYPDSAVLFSRVVLLTSLADSFTVGLGTANQAIGKLKIYSLVVFTTKLLTLPVLILMIAFGVSIDIAIWSYLVIELVSAILRLPILKSSAGLDITNYISEFCRYTLLPAILLVILYIVIYYYLSGIYEIFVSIIVASILYIISLYFIGLKKIERVIVNGIFDSILNKIKRS